MSLRASFLFTLSAGSLFTQVVSADAPAACFPSCRSGFVCSSEAKCVSLCNPPCGNGESCSNGECHAKAEATSSAEPIVDRKFELGLGVGYQRIGAGDFFAPALAFRFVLPLGLVPHLVFGARVGAGLGPSVVGQFGLDLGYRHRIGAENAPVRGGFFVTLRPEIWPNVDAFTSGRNAAVAGGSLGGFIELERVIFSLPLAAGYGKVLGHGTTFGYFSVSAEAAIRF